MNATNPLKPAQNPVAVERRRIYFDLLEHCRETGELLPMNPLVIADLEMAGWIVDLQTGLRRRDPEHPRHRFGITPV